MAAGVEVDWNGILPLWPSAPRMPGRKGACGPIPVEEHTSVAVSASLASRRPISLLWTRISALSPTGGFKRNGRFCRLLDTAREGEAGGDSKPRVRTVTMPGDTNNMEKILQTLDAGTGAASAARSAPDFSEVNHSLRPGSIWIKSRVEEPPC